jgi:hypothetical protein
VEEKLHNPNAVPQGRRPPVPTVQNAERALDAKSKKKKSLPPPEIKLQFFSCPVTSFRDKG